MAPHSLIWSTSRRGSGEMSNESRVINLRTDNLEGQNALVWTSVMHFREYVCSTGEQSCRLSATSRSAMTKRAAVMCPSPGVVARADGSSPSPARPLGTRLVGGSSWPVGRPDGAQARDRKHRCYWEAWRRNECVTTSWPGHPAQSQGVLERLLQRKCHFTSQGWAGTRLRYLRYA